MVLSWQGRERHTNVRDEAENKKMDKKKEEDKEKEIDKGSKSLLQGSPPSRLIHALNAVTGILHHHPPLQCPLHPEPHQGRTV